MPDTKRLPPPLATGITLEVLLSAAMQEASDAIASWTGGAASFKVGEVRELPFEEASAEFDFGDEPQVNVVLTLDEPLSGVVILVFDQDGARDLARLLTSRPAASDDGWSRLERSALEETGNILACAYLNAIARWIGAPLVPSPPHFIVDFGACVLEQALAGQAACEQALICRTVFRHRDDTVDWSVFFFPSPELRERWELAIA